MLIFNPIEAGVSPLLKTIKILYKADFCLFYVLIYCKSPLGSNVCVPLSVFNTSQYFILWH